MSPNTQRVTARRKRMERKIVIVTESGIQKLYRSLIGPANRVDRRSGPNRRKEDLGRAARKNN